MVRKQIYIEVRQDRALKRRAQRLGISEAEIVRAALDATFTMEPVPSPLPGHVVALEAFLARARELSDIGHRLPKGGLRRQELYDDREDRWARGDASRR